MTKDLLFSPAVRAAETLQPRFELNNLLCLVLGVGFLGTGIAKVGATDFVVQTFQGWNLAPGLLVTIGLVEMLAAVLTIIPTTRLLGTGLISAIMVGALGYHAVRAEFLLGLIPAGALVLAATSNLIELSLRRAEPARVPVTAR